MFFVISLTASDVHLSFQTNSIWIFSTRVLSFFTRLSRTRDCRLASEIPLSILVAVDRLTFFGSVRIRYTKALRKNQWEESNPQHRNGRVSLGGTAISSSLDRALPSLRHRDHRALLGKQPEIGDISSKRHDFVSIGDGENGACSPRLAPQCLHFLVIGSAEALPILCVRHFR